MNNTEIGNAINLLVREGYLLINQIGPPLGQTEPIIYEILPTGKVNRFYAGMVKELQAQKPQETSVVFQKESITLKEFRDRAKIPHQIKTKNFTFNTGRISIPAERVFNKEVVGKVDMEKLIRATEAYYKNERVSRVTLTNYFTEGIWESVYKEYTKQPEVAKPNFTGERSL